MSARKAKISVSTRLDLLTKARDGLEAAARQGSGSAQSYSNSDVVHGALSTLIGFIEGRLHNVEEIEKIEQKATCMGIASGAKSLDPEGEYRAGVAISPGEGAYYRLERRNEAGRWEEIRTMAFPEVAELMAANDRERTAMHESEVEK